MPQSPKPKSKCPTWSQYLVNNQAQVSVKNVVPSWLLKPAGNVVAGIGTANTVARFGSLSLGALPGAVAQGGALGGSASAGSILVAGATAYEVGTWGGSAVVATTDVLIDTLNASPGGNGSLSNQNLPKSNSNGVTSCF